MWEHAGHRQRLLKKIETEELSAHEYLEAFLFPLIPRVNTNPLAHRLLARFGTVRGVFNATLEQLKEIEGIGNTVAVQIYTAGKLFALRGENEIRGFFPQKYNRQEFLGFVRQEYECISCEVLDVFFLDGNGSINARKRYTTDEQGKVCVNGKELDDFAKENKPAGMVIVHNHPLGTSSPSGKDDDTTKKLFKLCRDYRIILCDHIIFSDSGAFSYATAGKIELDERGEG